MIQSPQPTLGEVRAEKATDQDQSAADADDGRHSRLCPGLGPVGFSFPLASPSVLCHEAPKLDSSTQEHYNIIAVPTVLIKQKASEGFAGQMHVICPGQDPAVSSRMKGVQQAEGWRRERSGRQRVGQRRSRIREN